jgi:hypothetical protein
MSPPTEQLIRDYLNRLSVAARGRLSAEDRRALVTRTHDFIDRNASPSGPPTSLEVATLLHRLGSPDALVDQEVARLADERGEAAAPAEKSEKGSGVFRRLSAHSSWHWPSAPGSADLRSQLLNGHSQQVDHGADGDQTADAPVPPLNGKSGATAPAVAGGQDRPAWPSAAFSTQGAEAEPATERQSATAPPAISAAARPATASSAASAPDASSAAGDDSAPGYPSAPVPASASGSGRAAGTEALWKPRNPLVVVLTARAAALWRRTLAWARRSPVEAAALTLLGVGGAAYPPVWLLGALLTLASRGWDYRDKWIGLAIPVLILVVGTTFGVTFGVRYNDFSGYVHEGWVYADVLSRIGAVAGAAYLAWRLTHARRVPTVPPWNKPHRVD